MNADTFNALYEVGIPVFAYPGARPEDFPKATRLVTRTRSKATVLGGHTDVVWVDGHSACIALSHVDVVTEDEWKAAQTAEAVADRGALPMPVGSTPTVDELLATIARLGRKVDSLKSELKRSDDEYEAVVGERARYRLAWQSARERAQAYGEGILRVVEDRESYQGWLKEAEENYAAYRSGAEAVKQMLTNRINAVLDLCDREQRNAMRWEDPIPVPDWVAPVQRAALGDDKRPEAAS